MLVMNDKGVVRESLGRAGDLMMSPVKIIERRKDRDDGERVFGVVPAEPRWFIDQYGY